MGRNINKPPALPREVIMNSKKGTALQQVNTPVLAAIRAPDTTVIIHKVGGNRTNGAKVSLVK